VVLFSELKVLEFGVNEVEMDLIERDNDILLLRRKELRLVFVREFGGCRCFSSINFNLLRNVV